MAGLTPAISLDPIERTPRFALEAHVSDPPYRADAIERPTDFNKHPLY
jgi:hypothetical protein